MFEVEADEAVQALVTSSLINCSAFRHRLDDLRDNEDTFMLNVEIAFDLVVLANKFMLLGLKGIKIPLIGE